MDSILTNLTTGQTVTVKDPSPALNRVHYSDFNGRADQRVACRQEWVKLKHYVRGKWSVGETEAGEFVSIYPLDVTCDACLDRIEDKR